MQYLPSSPPPMESVLAAGQFQPPPPPPPLPWEQEVVLCCTVCQSAWAWREQYGSLCPRCAHGVAPAPAAATGSIIPDPLGRLERTWVSKRYGAIIARRQDESEREAPSEHGPDLLVYPMTDWSCGASPLGSLYLCNAQKYCRGAQKGQHIVFEIFGVNGVKTSWVWLSVVHSRKRRVIWDDNKNNAADVWDCCLLDAVQKAGDWVEERKLDAQLDTGLPRLINPAETTSSKPFGGFSVALCIATMNRLWQLRRALPLNLLHCWPHRKWTKIHVVDFGSSDGTLDFLLSRCRSAIDCGLLSVYTTDELRYWHASVAKNTVHACAGEDILVNVDGDNLIGPDFPVNVAENFHKGYTVLQYAGGEGTCGRIACTRADFLRIRGYDEDAYPMGAQDVDLVLRLKSLPDARFRKVKEKDFGQAIPNSLDLKVACCSPDQKIKWGQMDAVNRAIFKLRRDAGQIARNHGKSNIGVKAWRADT